MNTTFEAQLRSQSTFIMALLESRHPCDRLHRGHVPCLEEIRRVSLNGERLGLELYGLAESVICSDGDRQVSVRALLDELEAQLPIDPNASSEQLEHDYADAVVSLACKLGPISGEALLFCARVEASRVASERYDEDNDTLILEAEWAALSKEEQYCHWLRFHDLCAVGLGDEHRFYSLLMTRTLANYEGE